MKASLGDTHKQGFMAGACSFPRNPCDRYTLVQQTEPSRILLQGRDVMPMTAVVDLGCAAGYDTRWLLREIASQGLKAAYFRLGQLTAMAVRSLDGAFQWMPRAVTAAQVLWVLSGQVTALTH